MHKRTYNWLMALVIMGVAQNSFGILPGGCIFDHRRTEQTGSGMLPGGCIFDERVKNSNLIYSNEVQTEHEAYSADIYQVGENVYILSMKCVDRLPESPVTYSCIVNFMIDDKDEMVFVTDIRVRFSQEACKAFLADTPLGKDVNQEIGRFLESL